MVDPKLGRQCMGVPLPQQPEPQPKRASMADSRDEPGASLAGGELQVLLAHLQGVEERYQADLAALRREVDELSERTSKLPSTPPGNVDISKGPQGLRVRGPAGYALAITVLVCGAFAAWLLRPLLAK